MWNASLKATGQVRISAEGRHLNVRGFVVDTLSRIGDVFAEEVPISGAPRVSPQNAFLGWVLENRKYFVQVWTMRRVKQWYHFAMKHAKIYDDQDKRFAAYLYTLTAGYSSIDPDSLTILKRSYTL